MAAPEPARAAPPPPSPPPPPPGADRVVKGERWTKPWGPGLTSGVWGRAGDRPLRSARKGGRVTGCLPWGVAPGRAPAGLGWKGSGGSCLSLAFGPGRRFRYRGLLIEGVRLLATVSPFSYSAFRSGPEAAMSVLLCDSCSPDLPRLTEGLGDLRPRGAGRRAVRNQHLGFGPRLLPGDSHPPCSLLLSASARASWDWTRVKGRGRIWGPWL